jgi:hypothetical protein
MTLRIFLAVEGANDGGALGKSLTPRDNDPSNEGALQPLVHRSAASSALEIRGQKIMLVPTGRIADPAEVVGKRARVASEIAAYDGCDAVVLHMDVDGPSDGSIDHGPTAWTALSNEVADGFAVAANSGSGLPTNRCIACLPLRTIEAWLLGDAAAVTRRAATGSIDVSADIEAPEALWEPQRVTSGKHPKRVLARAVGGAGAKISTRDYRAIAEDMDLDEVESTCPVSFSPFRSAMGTALTP